MADKMEAIADALRAVGVRVTFREESEELAFGVLVDKIAPPIEEVPELEELTKVELLAAAEAAGIEGVTGNSTKAEILAALEEAAAGEGA